MPNRFIFKTSRETTATTNVCINNNDNITENHTTGSHSPTPQYLKQAWRRPGPQSSRGPPEHESHRRTTAGWVRASGGSHSSHSAEVPVGCSNKSPGSWVHQSRPSTGPETQGHPTPQHSQGPGPTKQPPVASRHTLEHPAPHTENYQCTRWVTSHWQGVLDQVTC